MLPKSIHARTYIYIPTQSCLDIDFLCFDARPAGCDCVRANLPGTRQHDSTAQPPNRSVFHSTERYLAYKRVHASKKNRRCTFATKPSMHGHLSNWRTACGTIGSGAGYSCCASGRVRALGGKQGYLVPILIDTSILAHDLDRQNE